MLTLGSLKGSLNNEFKESRFSKGEICPHCESTSIVKNIDVWVKTSFYMRHKILDCIRTFMGIGDVDGIVEMDETFVALSYKGNHKKSGFTLPRPARKRSKQIKKRGISNEQVCIATAIDRN